MTNAHVCSRPSQPALATPAITNGVSLDLTASLRANSNVLPRSSASGLQCGRSLVGVKSANVWGGGGGPTTKKTKDILRFSRRHDHFCSLFEDILLTKSGKNNKKEQKRSIKIKKDQNHDLFCPFLRTHFDQIGHKNVDFERVLKKNKKEQKRQRTSWVFPGGMIFFVVGPPPPPCLEVYYVVRKFNLLYQVSFDISKLSKNNNKNFLELRLLSLCRRLL